MNNNKEPKCNKIAHIHSNFSDQRLDNYHWLKDVDIMKSKNPDIMNYLQEEKQYCDSFFENHSALLDSLFKELKSKIKLSDKSVPIKKNNYCYYFSIEEKENYYRYHRYSTASPDVVEEIFDENVFASNGYFSLGAFSINYQENKLAYSIDLEGNERYKIYIKDLEKNILLNDYIENVVDDVVWHKSGEGFYYVVPDSTWRPYRVYFHKIGDEQENDQLLYEENDNMFGISISASSDDNYLIINVHSKESSEYYYLNMNESILSNLILFYSRRYNHLVSMDIIRNEIYALINDRGSNFRLISSYVDNNEMWSEILSVDSHKYLTNFCLYNKFIAVQYKENGLNHIKVRLYNSDDWKNIPVYHECYSLNISSTYYLNDAVRYVYSSLNQPATTYEFMPSDAVVEIKKKTEIPSGFDSNLYEVKRLFLEARDGIKVPISILYRKDKFNADGNNELYLYGYGSYGIGIDPSFNRNIISLVDKGFIYCIAHIRGGDDLGFDWYEKYKFLNKKTTFNDFVDAIQFLINNKYTQKGKVTIMGGSAGGMLVMNVTNQIPEIIKNTIAHVPFVDVLNTMLDKDLPLTTGEYLEWGNPNVKDFYEYMKSYSPYDNIGNYNYPNIYLTTSIGDTRVAYWESAKMIAKLREFRKNNNKLFFDINLHAGHGGASSRDEALLEKAREYAFILVE